jgi:cellulose synthase/poly-beta-1,6-N-acetylglucosamine synthase-like glycosyltransferase
MSNDMLWISIFITSLIIISYVYAGYPVIVYVIGLFYHRKITKYDYEPTVSILIAAYNEESCIERTIKNKLTLNYPSEKLKIVVISDGSDDKTDEIVKSFAGQGVTLLRQEPRAGKTSALNMAVNKLESDILVFSDANSLYETEAIHKLVQNFADHEIGYVTGKMVYTNSDGTIVGDGCSAYMKYENFLRAAETRIGSVVGVDGGIDAVRKSIYRKMNPDQLPDFVLPLKVVEQGYRVVYEPKALLQEASLDSSSDEYRMRVRVTLRALWALFDMRQLLFGRKQTLFAWQLWSHKVLRYTCFIFLVTLYVSNLALIQKGRFYLFFFVGQTLAYLAAAIYPKLERSLAAFSLFRLMNYFVIINLAALHAFIKFIKGKKQILWTPRKG